MILSSDVAIVLLTWLQSYEFSAKLILISWKKLPDAATATTGESAATAATR